MMNPIVYALAETPMRDTVGETFGERAGVAGSVTLLGMVTIFAVLAILWGVIEALHRVLNRGGKTDTPAAKPAAPAAKPAAEAKKHAQATQVTQAVKATETANWLQSSPRLLRRRWRKRAIREASGWSLSAEHKTARAADNRVLKG